MLPRAAELRSLTKRDQSCSSREFTLHTAFDRNVCTHDRPEFGSVRSTGQLVIYREIMVVCMGVKLGLSY